MEKNKMGKQNNKKSNLPKKNTAKKSNSFSTGTIAIVIVIILVLGFVVFNAANTAGGGPSGNVCAENIAYLQDGVNRFQAAFGVFPTELEQLLEARDGLEPFVETIDLRCPSSGRPYIIENGIVRDS